MMSEQKKAPKEAKASEEKHPAPKLVKHDSNKPHHMKLTQMSLQDIDHALDEAQKKMGGLTSQYARFLLARKEFLLSQRVTVARKAA
jgi:hypothetical protein